MNQTEAVGILTYLNRAGLVGAMEGASAVWADALHDVPYTTAQEVVREMTRARTSDQRWVTPGDVAYRVRQIRTQRLKDAQRDGLTHYQPPEELGGNPRAEIRWSKAYDDGIGDGLIPAEADKRACQQLGVVRREIGPDLGPGQLRGLITQTTNDLTGERP